MEGGMDITAFTTVFSSMLTAIEGAVPTVLAGAGGLMVGLLAFKFGWRYLKKAAS